MTFAEIVYKSKQHSPEDRKNDCYGVVWHHTGGGIDYARDVCTGKIKEHTGKVKAASYHCVIEQNGTRHIFVPDHLRAWHAGLSCWDNRTSCNAFTLGVAFLGDTGKRMLTKAEVLSALEWLEPRWKKYGWSMDRMTTHRKICLPVGRKVDISKNAEFQLFTAIQELYG